jgi:hypothetical protein
MGAGAGALQRAPLPPSTEPGAGNLTPELRQAIDEYVANREPMTEGQNLLPREMRDIETPVGNLSRSQLMRYMERTLPGMIEQDPGIASLMEAAGSDSERLFVFRSLLAEREQDRIRNLMATSPEAREAFEDVEVQRRSGMRPESVQVLQRDLASAEQQLGQLVEARKDAQARLKKIDSAPVVNAVAREGVQAEINQLTQLIAGREQIRRDIAARIPETERQVTARENLLAQAQSAFDVAQARRERREDIALAPGIEVPTETVITQPIGRGRVSTSELATREIPQPEDDARAGAAPLTEMRYVLNPQYKNKKLVGGEAVSRIIQSDKPGKVLAYVERRKGNITEEVPVETTMDKLAQVPVRSTARATQEVAGAAVGPEQVAGRAGRGVDPLGQNLQPRRMVDRQGPQASARTMEEAQAAPEAEISESDARATRRIEAQKKINALYLDKLKDFGSQGRLIRNALVQALKDRTMSAQEVYAAFTAADQLAGLLPAGANHRVEFVKELLPTGELAEAIRRSGGDPTKPLQGIRARPERDGLTGIIKLSLAQNFMPVLGETASHEAFHILQDYYGKFDPQFKKLMDQGFRDGMMITDVDPTIRRKLEQTAHPTIRDKKGNPVSYWRVLTASLPNTLEATEAQAYAFGSLTDAARRGVPMAGLKPAFARFVNTIKNFFSKLGGKLRGDGFQTVEEVLGRVARGDARRFDAMATPTEQDVGGGGPQLSARRFPGVRADGDHDDRVSQRVPTAKKATEDALGNDLPINTDVMARDPESFARNAGLIESYPNYRPDPSLTTPEEKVRAFKDHVVRNLLWLFDNTPSDIRDRSRLWYNGARRLAEDLAAKYNMSDSSVAGVMAVLSPQKDWFQNVSLAMRTIDIYKTKQDKVFDKKMREKLNEIFADDKYAELRQIVSNKSLSQLRGMNSDLRLAALAMWVRTYDQTYNSPSYASVSPEGELGEPVKTGKGAEARVAWGSLAEIAKGISVIEDGRKDNVSARVGNAHKVRNFFNNILAPDAKRGDVTIDTHAVAAANLRPLSQKAIEVAHGLGTSPGKGMPGASSSSLTGAQGLYGIYADAYREAADMRGVLPREMQSITWEAIRGLFSPAFKRNQKNIDAANDVWQSVRDGVATEEEARERIRSLAGGISAPSWATGGPDVVDDASLGAADEQGHVSGDELSGGEVRPEGAAAARVGGRDAGTVPSEGLIDQGVAALQSASRNVQASARGDVITDLEVVEASGTRDNANYTLVADLKSGGYLNIDVSVDDGVLTVHGLQPLNIQKNPFKYKTAGFGVYSEGVHLTLTGMRQLSRRVLEIMRRNHPNINEAQGFRVAGARMKAAREKGLENNLGLLAAGAKIRTPQASARSPLADDPAFTVMRDKLTGKEIDKPNVFADGLRRFVGALPGEKISSALVRTSVNRAGPGWMLDNLSRDKGMTVRNVGRAMEVALNNSGRVQMYLNHGPLAYDPKTGDVSVRDDVPGLIDAIKGKLNVADKREAQAYLVALRERDLRKTGKKGFFNLTDKEMNDIISKAESAHPEWKQMAADIQRINKALLDFAVNTGTLDRAKADQLGSMFYTPFYRQAEGDVKDDSDAVVGPRLSQSLTRVKTAFDVSVKGGENPLGDLFENMIRNADTIMKAGMKNVAMRQAAEALQDVGLGRPAKEREKGKTITYRVNGQDKHFEVDDPTLYVALAGAPREFTNGIYQTMANMAAFFRDMVTLAPSFMLANLWRGKIMAYVQEGVPLYTNTFDGLRQALRSSSSYKAIAAQTGFGGYTYGMGERDAAAAFEREIAGLGYGPGGLLRRTFDTLQKASEATEMAERIKLYERMKAQGMNDKEAAFQAYLLAPFSRRGMGDGWLGYTVNWLVPLVPFLNAKIQGMYRLIENEKGDTQKLWTLGLPKQMLLRGLVVMGLSLALFAKNIGDEPERWDNENPDLKFRYDIVYLPNDNRILLPRAFEVGSVFGAIPVFILDAIRRNDSRDLSKALADLGTSTFFFNPIPQAAVPLLGAFTNYDFFRSRSLETAGDASKLPEERVNRSTSAVAKAIGETFGISPIRTQYVLEGYSGTIGSSVLAGFDSILAAFGLVPGKPAGPFGDPMSMPAIAAGLTGASRFYRSDDQSASRFIGDFYKIKEMTDQLVRSQNMATESRDLDRLAELRGDAGLPLRLRPMVNQASTQITEINKRIARIERSDLTSVEKTEALRPLREQRDRVARRVVERARDIGAY